MSDNARSTVIEIVNRIEADGEWLDDDGNLDWDDIAIMSLRGKAPIVEYNDDEYMLNVDDYYVGEDEEGEDTWVVFSFEQFPDRFWRITGKYDSWSEKASTWRDNDRITEVFQKAVIKIIYEE